jgi:hypothetical protein
MVARNLTFAGTARHRRASFRRVAQHVMDHTWELEDRELAS